MIPIEIESLVQSPLWGAYVSDRRTLIYLEFHLHYAPQADKQIILIMTKCHPDDDHVEYL